MALNAEFFVKMPMSQKLLIVAAVVALLVLGYWFGIDSDLTAEYEAKNEQLHKKLNDLAKLETVEKDKEKLDRELKEKERNLEKAKEKLPTETEMEKLFLTISDIGQQNGITFDNFKPLGEGKVGNLYKEVPIDLKFSGSYPYVQNFFYEVTHLPRIVRFRGINIRTSKGSNNIDVSCVAVTFKFAGSK